MTCADCIHFDVCMERRGVCTEFKTLEDIANDVKRINENFKEIATRTQDRHKDD